MTTTSNARSRCVSRPILELQGYYSSQPHNPSFSSPAPADQEHLHTGTALYNAIFHVDSISSPSPTPSPENVDRVAANTPVAPTAEFVYADNNDLPMEPELVEDMIGVTEPNTKFLKEMQQLLEQMNEALRLKDEEMRKLREQCETLGQKLEYSRNESRRLKESLTKVVLKLDGMLASTKADAVATRKVAVESIMGITKGHEGYPLCTPLRVIITG
jgi:hypothetical protein